MEQRKNETKKVTFSVIDDIAYIYPWSPTKFLLFGKMTEEQLNRRKLENVESITSILNKNSQHDISNVKYMSQGIIRHASKKPGKRPRDSMSFIIANVFNENEAPKNLEEIQIDENSTDQKRPLLPSMAIFSPSGHKDLITNEIVPPPLLKPINQNHNVRRLPTSNFSMSRNNLGKKDEHTNPFPHLPNKYNDSIFGSFREKTDHLLGRPPKYLRMPSIDATHSLPQTSPRAKSLIRSQISQRYAIPETELDNIQHLHEEDFSNNESHISKHHRRPLPLLAEYAKKSIKTNWNNSDKQKSKVRNENIKKKCKNPMNKSNCIVGTNRRSSANQCKRGARLFGSSSTPPIVQLCISSKDISGGCCK